MTPEDRKKWKAGLVANEIAALRSENARLRKQLAFVANRMDRWGRPSNRARKARSERMKAVPELGL